MAGHGDITVALILIHYVFRYHVPVKHPKSIKLGFLNVEEHEVHKEGGHIIGCVPFIFARVILV